MLSETHIRIANKVLSEIGVSLYSDEAAYLRGGSVKPDEWKDFPHHRGKTNEIWKYIITARRYYLKGDLPSAYFNLGVAFHYLQDMWTTLSGSDQEHDLWERKIDNSSFLDLDDLLNFVKSTSIPEKHQLEYFRIAATLSSEEIEGKEKAKKITALRHPKWGTPTIDLNFAFRISLSIAKLVLGSKISSKLQDKLNVLLKEYEYKLRETESSFTEKLIRLVQKRDVLKQEKGIKGLFMALLSYIYDLRAKRMIKKYEKQEHLRKVARAYHKDAKKVSAPFLDWYNVVIPRIDISKVEKELLSILEASTYFETSEDVIQDLIDRKVLSCYYVGNKELVRKSELEEALRIEEKRIEEELWSAIERLDEEIKEIEEQIDLSVWWDSFIDPDVSEEENRIYLEDRAYELDILKAHLKSLQNQKFELTERLREIKRKFKQRKSLKDNRYAC